jgi:hypothetical protein
MKTDGATVAGRDADKDGLRFGEGREFPRANDEKRSESNPAARNAGTRLDPPEKKAARLREAAPDEKERRGDDREHGRIEANLAAIFW